MAREYYQDIAKTKGSMHSRIKLQEITMQLVRSLGGGKWVDWGVQEELLVWCWCFGIIGFFG